MDLVSTGKTIARLRKAARLTQSSLADKLGISDKAVSKWERGITCPDVSLWNKLSILLDTDIESLIYGNENATGWMGVLYLNESIPAETTIYNKRLIEYLISQFLLVGINKIVIIGKCEEFSYPGIQLYFSLEASQLNQWFTEKIFVIFGNHFIYGPNMTKHIKRAMARTDGITILASMKQKGKYPLVVDENKVANLTSKHTRNQFYAEPFVFIPDNRKLFPDTKFYDFIKNGNFNVETMVRGMACFDIDSFDVAFNMAEYIKIMENITSERIGCVEEIIIRRGIAEYKEVKRTADKETQKYLLNAIGNMFDR